MAAIGAVDVDGIGAVSRSRFSVMVLAVLPTVSRNDLSFDRDFVPRDFVDFVDFDESPESWHRALRHPHGAWPSLALFYL